MTTHLLSPTHNADGPHGEHATYQLQYRRCGKPLCQRCKTNKGHGPYWYMFYRENGKLRSKYVGKTGQGHT